MQRTRRRFSGEFKQGVVLEVLAGVHQASVARRPFGIGEQYSSGVTYLE